VAANAFELLLSRSGLGKPGLRTEAPNRDELIDQQFKIWMAMVRMSPWSAVMRQQIRVARALMEFPPTTRD
jgi:hypothetical protein